MVQMRYPWWRLPRRRKGAGLGNWRCCCSTRRMCESESVDLSFELGDTSFECFGRDGGGDDG